MVAQLCVEAVQLKVPMRCDLKFGRNWGDAKHSWEELSISGEAAPASISISASVSTSELEPAPEPKPELEPAAVQGNGHDQSKTEEVAATGGPYAQHAETLIARGYAAVPIMLGTKAPGFFCAGSWMPLPAWQRRFLNKIPSRQQRELWSKGETGIGVVGGRASHGLIGIDVDTDNPPIKTALIAALPATPVRKVGA